MKTQAQPADIAMELNARFRGPLKSYFSRRIRNQAEVEDLVQEVLLKVLRASASPDIRHAEAYIFTTARNLLRDRHRQAVRQGVQGYLSIEEAEALQADGHLVEEITPERVLIGMEPGQQLLLSEDAQPVLRVTDVSHATAWENGRLVFEGEKLGDVVARFNRYSSRQIQLVGEGVAEQRISGVFLIQDLDGFVATVTAYLPLAATITSRGSIEIRPLPAN